MAVIDEQLGGAGMRDDLLYLTEVDQEGAMAADNHRVALQRFCIRNVLKSWFPAEATDDLPSASHLTLGHQQASLHGPRSFDDFIWKVCHLSEQEGWNELPPPSL